MQMQHSHRKFNIASYIANLLNPEKCAIKLAAAVSYITAGTTIEQNIIVMVELNIISDADLFSSSLVMQSSVCFRGFSITAGLPISVNPEF